MTTVSNASEYTRRLRRRLAETASGASQTRKLFGDKARAWLPIPTIIDLYNYYAKGVDRADQLRSYYTSLKKHRKTWKPLFSFLLNTVTTNCYKLSSFASPSFPYRAGHKAFLQKLIYTLLERSVRVLNYNKGCTDKVIWKPAVLHGYKAERISDKLLICLACLKAGRTTSIKRINRRKPLADLSINLIERNSIGNNRKRRQRAPRTRYGCRLCRIPLCKIGQCFQSHLDLLNSKK